MRGAGLFLCLIGFAASQNSGSNIPGTPRQLPGTPRFEVHQSKSPWSIPSIDVTFANGVQDSLVLERFYPTEQSRMERKLSCNFFGHLRDEETACVAVTGCPGDDMYFTINSKNSGARSMFILHKDGSVEVVESAFKDKRVKSGTLRVPGSKYNREEPLFVLDGDELKNPDQIDEEMTYEKLCASGDCSSMPAKQKMQIRIHYDDTFNDGTSNVDGYLDQMATHLQTHFCQTSLGTQIKIEVLGSYTHHAGEEWRAESASGSLSGPIKNIAAADTSGADLNVFMCKDPQFYGVVGLAYVGTMCKTYLPGYNAGVNEKRGNILSTSEVVAHEMGHNMGMLHDFDEEHGGDNGACDGTGIMSYGSAPNVWSTCSKNDFNALYNSIIGSNSLSWCLDVDNTACGGDGTTTTPTTQGPTAPPPPAGTCADMPTFMTNADRIVGGEAAPSPIPWQVSLQSNGFAFCGATILDASTVLCAAHCTPSTSHSIRVGSITKSSGGQVRNVAQVIYNNNEGYQYNSGTLENDFVIIKLDSPLTLNNDVQPACLPSSSTYLGVSSTEEQCFTSGWGTLSSGGSSPNTLQYVRVPAITNEACNDDYGGSITDSMICAGYPGVGEKDACQGDSGGPFVCNDGGKAVIAGVVSWGNGCALADFPGVYARTTHVLDWIKEQMGSNGTGPTTAPPPTDGCGSPQWENDDYCDDENNNEGCNWDGGDCCFNNATGWDNYCTDCECLECIPSGWHGDGICDDGNLNTENCLWDGGDCCDDVDNGVFVNTNYCTECQCLDPVFATTTTTTATTTTTVNTTTTGCGSPQWAKDQFCDDENNNVDCNFDGGDCCFNDHGGWDTYCEDCECLECQPGDWHGDDYCDDELNTENCKYDGGDCCGEDTDITYCEDCLCLDPSAKQ